MPNRSCSGSLSSFCPSLGNTHICTGIAVVLHVVFPTVTITLDGCHGIAPFASLKEQVETLFRLICCERKTMFQLIYCERKTLFRLKKQAEKKRIIRSIGI